MPLVFKYTEFNKFTKQEKSKLLREQGLHFEHGDMIGIAPMIVTSGYTDLEYKVQYEPELPI